MAAWAFFIPVAVIGADSVVGTLLATLGALTPAPVALWLTSRAAGRAGVRALIDQVFVPRVRARWYLFALIFMPAVKLMAAVIHRLATGAWPRFDTESLVLIPVAIAISTPFQAGEEIGWRGYALPRLAARIGMGPASVVLGVIWAAWHLPLFFARGADTFGQAFLVYGLQVIALSVVMAWLYAHTEGSLLPVMLMHAAVNNTKDIVPSATPGAHDPFGAGASLVAWLTVALLWACAAYALARMPVAPGRREAPPDPRIPKA